ncbi:LOW QUALITY PROTEIN: RxLR effector candidate protein [Phytophthora palmivora]|uniref:RxLR effector candidate protein n=1 Tax=Phytophthora palmivora TaxID=4796 RepID=A0A2P4XSS0_9STRA|nr:LOW QUALITY PROTEIN: RxLR effector candidate protein [Phytophthora palmivora]
MDYSLEGVRQLRSRPSPSSTYRDPSRRAPTTHDLDLRDQYSIRLAAELANQAIQYQATTNQDRWASTLNRTLIATADTATCLHDYTLDFRTKSCQHCRTSNANVAFGFTTIPTKTSRCSANNATLLRQIRQRCKNLTNDALDAHFQATRALFRQRKPAGQCTSLRPIVLLNSIRKAVSLITLMRISPKVEAFLSPCQSGFRPNRSTADAVWAPKWIAARAQTYVEKFYVLGIDMSRAFDTIDRDKLLSVLRTFLNNDEIRLICLLLQDTTLALRNGRHVLSPFISNTEASLRNLANELDLPRSILQDMTYTPTTQTSSAATEQPQRQVNPQSQLS